VSRERPNGRRLLIVQQGEIGLRQAADRMARLIRDHNAQADRAELAAGTAGDTGGKSSGFCANATALAAQHNRISGIFSRA